MKCSSQSIGFPGSRKLAYDGGEEMLTTPKRASDRRNNHPMSTKQSRIDRGQSKCVLDELEGLSDWVVLFLLSV
jgi:hypothetical protein